MFGGVALLLTVAQHPDGVASVLQGALRKLERLVVSRVRRASIRHRRRPGRRGGKVVSVVLRARGISVRYGGVHASARRRPRGRGGTARRADRPERRRQDHLHRRDHRLHPGGGSIEVDGVDITALPPDRRARCGLARTWQSAELFDELKVRENLAVTGGRPSVGQVLRELLTARAVQRPAVARMLELLELQALANAMPNSLTQGQRKLVGVGRALAAEPRLVCLDEPAAGLDSTESEKLGRHLREIVELGTAMLLVDHDMGLVLSVCDHVVVLDFGNVIASGSPDEVRRHQRVVEAYLGRAAGATAAVDAAVEAT